MSWFRSGFSFTNLLRSLVHVTSIVLWFTPIPVLGGIVPFYNVCEMLRRAASDRPSTNNSTTTHSTVISGFLNKEFLKLQRKRKVVPKQAVPGGHNSLDFFDPKFYDKHTAQPKPFPADTLSDIAESPTSSVCGTQRTSNALVREEWNESSETSARISDPRSIPHIPHIPQDDDADANRPGTVGWFDAVETQQDKPHSPLPPYSPYPLSIIPSNSSVYSSRDKLDIASSTPPTSGPSSLIEEFIEAYPRIKELKREHDLAKDVVAPFVPPEPDRWVYTFEEFVEAYLRMDPSNRMRDLVHEDDFSYPRPCSRLHHPSPENEARRYNPDSTARAMADQFFESFDQEFMERPMAAQGFESHDRDTVVRPMAAQDSASHARAQTVPPRLQSVTLPQATQMLQRLTMGVGVCVWYNFGPDTPLTAQDVYAMLNRMIGSMWWLDEPEIMEDAFMTPLPQGAAVQADEPGDAPGEREWVQEQRRLTLMKLEGHVEMEEYAELVEELVETHKGLFEEFEWI